MPRPKGSLNKSTIAKIQSGELAPRNGVVPVIKKVDTRQDSEILGTTITRFEMFAKMVEAAAHGRITATVGSGSPGIGKTTVVRQILEGIPDIRFKFISGTLSPIELYCVGMEYSNAGDVLIIDDADKILEKMEGLNILKAMTGTGAERWVSWMTDHARFKGDDGLPKQYKFNGSIVILTNQKLDETIKAGGKDSEHLEAVLSRSIYIDLMLHTRREVMVWVRHMVKNNKILQKLGITPMQEDEALAWLDENRDRVRELSLRTAEKIPFFMEIFPDDWKKHAEVALVIGGA